VDIATEQLATVQRSLSDAGAVDVSRH
jgi:hypothetical protein